MIDPELQAQLTRIETRLVRLMLAHNLTPEGRHVQTNTQNTAQADTCRGGSDHTSGDRISAAQIARHAGERRC